MFRYIFTNIRFTFSFIFLIVIAALFCVWTLHDLALFKDGISCFRLEKSWKKCDNFCMSKTTNSVILLIFLRHIFLLQGLKSAIFRTCT